MDFLEVSQPVHNAEESNANDLTHKKVLGERGRLLGSRYSSFASDDISVLSQDNEVSILRLFFLRAAWTLIFFVILLNCYSIFFKRKEYSEGNPMPPPLFNGSHYFRPTVILLSYDGFRSDYLERDLTPTIAKLASEGVKAEYMIPCFPSVTFSNHYTIVTGLYPESHGIVGNDFYDPHLNDSFLYTNPGSLDKKWWGGEPLWVTAEKQKQYSGAIMWPGSEAVIKGYRPTYLMPYNSSVTWDQKVEQVLDWLDLPIEKRPTFIAIYEEKLDTIGHVYGPDSEEVNKTLTSVDNMLQTLIDGLSTRNLTNISNLIITSDHGMMQTKPHIIYLENFINISLIHPVEGFPLAGIRPYNEDDITEIYSILTRASNEEKRWKCYLRNRIPWRFHYRNSDRICPILCLPSHGWIITTHREFRAPKPPLGLHGYDNLLPEIRAIFLAHGPTFQYLIETNQIQKEVEAFRNVEIYNIITNILGLKPVANNGTLGGVL
ncbi:hypothetical protein G9A89_014907 [Geosiphon pyriformis]|nr:hypothetical protein G9A89_014907 [Geosiphon pyriformis]